MKDAEYILLTHCNIRDDAPESHLKITVCSL
jgi:hypothetical protein